MKKINYLIAFCCSLISLNLFADLTIDVSVTSVQVAGMCDLDGFGNGDSDPQWDINVSDNRDYSEDFSHEVSGSNGPNITVNSGYENSLTFSHLYSGICPPNFLTIDWSGFEDDLASTEVRFDEIEYWSVPIVAGTYTLTRSGTASGCGGDVTWTINLQMVVSGSLNYACSDSPCAADTQIIQDPCDATLDFKIYDVSTSTSTFPGSSTACPYDESNDIFFKFIAPTAGAITIWIDGWSDFNGATQANLTGNIYGGPDCYTLSIASGTVIDGDEESQSMDCIDFSSGIFNTSNEGPFNVSGLTPGTTYYLRVTEEDEQSANVTLAFAEKLLEDDCLTAQPLAGVGCNYNAGGDDFNTPFDAGIIQDCEWTNMDNSVFYSFSVTASTPRPVSITVENINCDDTGGGTLQLAIWKKPADICTNTALQNANNYIACTYGTGSVTIYGGNLPIGDYLLLADGTAGAQCRWNFESVALLSCSIVAVYADIGTTCNDNGTPTDATDDYYVATITVTYNNPPATGNLVLSGSAIAASTPTANLTQAVGALATPAVFNNIRIKAGITNQTITATFSDETTCTFSNTTISSSPACAATCPDLTAQAPVAIVSSQSTCSNCMLSGGLTAAPTATCPTGSTLQYSTDGTIWTTSLPDYNQTTSITITTRCNCDIDNTQSSPTNSVSTIPGTCTPPSPSADNNAPACGATLNLSALGGVEFAWSGPNSFTSAVQNPSIPSFNATMAGTYTVVVTDANGCSATANTVVNNCMGVAPVLGLTDPCNCTNGLDLDANGVKEYAQEVITITPGTPPYNVTAVTGLFSATGVALTTATATSLITGPDASGNYSITAYVPANGVATYSLTVQDANLLSDDISGGPCASCCAASTNMQWNP